MRRFKVSVEIEAENFKEARKIAEAIADMTETIIIDVKWMPELRPVSEDQSGEVG